MNQFITEVSIFSLHQKLDSHKTIKSAVQIDFSRHLIIYSSKTKNCISSIQVPIEIFQILENDSTEKSRFLILPS